MPSKRSFGHTVSGTEKTTAIIPGKLPARHNRSPVLTAKPLLKAHFNASRDRRCRQRRHQNEWFRLTCRTTCLKGINFHAKINGLIRFALRGRCSAFQREAGRPGAWLLSQHCRLSFQRITGFWKDKWRRQQFPMACFAGAAQAWEDDASLWEVPESAVVMFRRSCVGVGVCVGGGGAEVEISLRDVALAARPNKPWMWLSHYKLAPTQHSEASKIAQIVFRRE